MPPLIKQTVPHILISMFVAPVMLALFAWAGTNIIDNKSAKLEIPHITDTINKVYEGQKATNSKMDSVLVILYEDRARVGKLEVMVENCKEDTRYCKSLHNVK